MKKYILPILFLNSAIIFAQEIEKNPPNKEVQEKNIEQVTLVKTKKAIEQKADRTIFDISEQPQLNTGTALEGIKKLPGVINSDLAGMSYQGKPLEVYMDNRPLNISSLELNSFLEGIPASSIERIEIITHPGAEFPATGGGAIMNIITSRSAKNYLTATYTGNYSFSNEEKMRNKTNQSILLNAKNKWFGWQLNTGTNYQENLQIMNIENLMNSKRDQINRGYFARLGLVFNLGQDRLLLNYNINHNNDNDSPKNSGNISGFLYQRQDQSKSLRWRHEAMATYQKRFSDPDKKLDFKASYENSFRDFNQSTKEYLINQIPTPLPTYSTSAHNRVAEFKVDYSQNINLLDKAKIDFGGLYQNIHYITYGNHIKNLDYQRNTYSTYTEIQTSKNKWNFTLGIRAETHQIYGKTYNLLTSNTENLKEYNRTRFFPNASIQYDFSKMLNLSLNYNHKISLPSISMLNPNADFNNGNFQNTGNANIQPTLHNNLGIKISAMNFFFLGYDLNLIENQIMSVMTQSGDLVKMTSENIPSVKNHNFYMGIPIPLAIFTKPVKEIMKSNPDKMSFIYLMSAYSFRHLPNLSDKNELWYFNLNGQIILPKDIKLGINYTIIPKGSEYFYFRLNDHLQNALNLTLSKKFLNNQLSVSLFVNDIFNTDKVNAHSFYGQNIQTWGKRDSRNFGITLNYKLPTKNKITKESQENLLLESKSEEKEGLIK